MAARAPSEPGIVVYPKNIYSMARNQGEYRAMAIRGEKIVGLSADPNGLGEFVSQGFNVVKLPELTILPGLIDTHGHLLQAAYSVFDVQIDQAKNIPELVELIRERSNSTPKGTWIRTSAA